MIINRNFWLPKYISWVIEQWSNSWICSAHAWVVLAFSVTSEIFLIMKIRISHTVYYIGNFMNYFVFCNVQRFCNCDDIKKICTEMSQQWVIISPMKYQIYFTEKFWYFTYKSFKCSGKQPKSKNHRNKLIFLCMHKDIKTQLFKIYILAWYIKIF